MLLKSLASAGALAAFLGAAQVADAATWAVQPDQSTLGFSVQQGDQLTEGRFERWSAAIEFDPASPETAVISATVETASAATGNAQFNSMLPGADWFDVGAFSVAEFKSGGVSLVEGNRYTAEGTLTIRGVAQPVTLDFTLDIDGNKAHASGTATVNRLAFDIGKTVATTTLGDPVIVKLDVVAVK